MGFVDKLMNNKSNTATRLCELCLDFLNYLKEPGSSTDVKQHQQKNHIQRSIRRLIAV